MEEPVIEQAEVVNQEEPIEEANLSVPEQEVAEDIIENTQTTENVEEPVIEQSEVVNQEEPVEETIISAVNQEEDKNVDDNIYTDTVDENQENPVITQQEMIEGEEEQPEQIITKEEDASEIENNEVGTEEPVIEEQSAELTSDQEEQEVNKQDEQIYSGETENTQDEFINTEEQPEESSSELIPLQEEQEAVEQQEINQDTAEETPQEYNEKNTQEKDEVAESSPVIPVSAENYEPIMPQEEQIHDEDAVIAPPSISVPEVEEQQLSPTIPAIENNNQDIKPQEEVQQEPLLTFIKISSDPAKAILTSARQISNLRASYKTQAALLNGRGSIASRNINGVDENVQALVDNGLLKPSPENIEEMMNKANQLYKEGKVNEAQEMYDQISMLNKQLQESSSVYK